jgi:hypothetical protein
MRAKMSDRRFRTIERDAVRSVRPESATWAGEWAVDEAQTILRETEPTVYPDGCQPGDTRSDMRLTVATRDYAGYRVACDCLADALAAFVAEEK